MPHDKNGVELKEGDIVILRCIVKNISPSEHYCNATITPLEPMPPYSTANDIGAINTQQLELEH